MLFLFLFKIVVEIWQIARNCYTNAVLQFFFFNDFVPFLTIETALEKSFIVWKYNKKYFWNIKPVQRE